MESGLYYLWAVLLIIACGLAWLTTLFSVPGNWLIAGFAALFAWLLPASETGGVRWMTVFVLLGLARYG